MRDSLYHRFGKSKLWLKDPLNGIWVFFFVSSFLTALFQTFFFGGGEIFPKLLNSLFEMSKTGFEVALGLTGVLTLWMGILRVGEASGFVQLLTRFLQPLFRRLLPEVPSNHPALGSISMNMAANMMGLDNAATPMGLKAMKELQELNEEKEVASNAQILFLVINTSSVTIFPVTIFAYRAQLGASNPTDVFIPILIATFCSTMAGLISVAMVQKIQIFNRVVLLYLVGFTAAIGGILTYFQSLPSDVLEKQSSMISSFLLFSVIVLFIGGAFFKKENVYEQFIQGAKDGFSIAVSIIPYLVAILVAIGVFRASGLMDWMQEIIHGLVSLLSMDTRFVDSLPTAMMKPLSGSGARAMMIEGMKTFGADSFVGRAVSIIQGSTETTFYVLAVYFGSVGIRKTRHAVPCGLIADAVGITAAILMTYFFFGN